MYYKKQVGEKDTGILVIVIFSVTIRVLSKWDQSFK